MRHALSVGPTAAGTAAVPEIALRLEQLTRRQREIAALVAEGHSNRDIAATLVLTEGTVANHVRRILLLTGARSRAELAGWIGSPWRVLPDAVPDALLSIGADGQCLAANRAALALLGRRAVAGLSAAKLLADGGTWDAAWETLRRQDRWRGNLVLWGADGAALPVEVTACAVQSPRGPVYCLAFRGASERGPASRELHARLLVLPHDLRSPLAVIRGYVQRMGRLTGDPAASLIVDQVDRLVTLVDDFVDETGVGALPGTTPDETGAEPIDRDDGRAIQPWPTRGALRRVPSLPGAILRG